MRRPESRAGQGWHLLLACMMVSVVQGEVVPRLHFDISASVACHDVTPPEFQAAHADERLVQTVVDVSLLVAQGDAAAIGECLYHFYATERQITIHDYEPKTTLITDVVGNIQVDENQDSSQSAEATLGGQYDGKIQAHLGGGIKRQVSSGRHYVMLPPKALLAASGTVSRGAGVYFKLRPSPQTTLEGAHQFTLTLRVPLDWRGDYLRATCRAELMGGRPGGDGMFIVPLYMLGDAVAKERAMQLTHSERSLLAAAQQQQRAVRRASLPTVAHELALLPRQIPDDWLTRVIRAPASMPTESFEQHLPPSVQSAVEEYRQAKLSIVRW